MAEVLWRLHSDNSTTTNMFRVLGAAALAFVALSVLGPTTSLAANTSREARILYQKGSIAFKDGDDALAREYYRESLKLEETFDAMCNLARADARSSAFTDAYRHIRMCLYLFP